MAYGSAELPLGQHGAERDSMAQRNEGMAPRHAKNA